MAWFLPPFPPHSCVHDGVYKRQRRGTEYVFDSEWEMLQQAADLYRLATHVHRGQSASSRKCVCKWGSYFYCFCHFTRSPSYRSSLYTLLYFFSGTSSYFPFHPCFPLFIFLNTETAEVSFEKLLPTFPGFQASVHPLGSFLPWFRHCSMDSCKSSVLSPTWLLASSPSTEIGLPGNLCPWEITLLLKNKQHDV